MTTVTLMVVATAPAAVAALAAAVYACAGTLHIRRPDPETSRRVMADLDDYSWRARQLAQVYAHRVHEEIKAAHVDLAFERVYGPLRDLHPLVPRQPRGIDTISRWWQPEPVTGGPPLTVHRIPNLTGAAA